MAKAEPVVLIEACPAQQVHVEGLVELVLWLWVASYMQGTLLDSLQHPIRVLCLSVITISAKSHFDTELEHLTLTLRSIKFRFV